MKKLILTLIMVLFAATAFCADPVTDDGFVEAYVAP